MMVFIKRYRLLFVPVVYWLVYLGCRLTYNYMTEGYSPEFFQSIRHDGVFIFCSLLVFCFSCLRVDVSDKEFSSVIQVCIISFHLAALIVTLLICLWQGKLLLDVICAWQMGAAVLMLFLIPILTFDFGR